MPGSKWYESFLFQPVDKDNLLILKGEGHCRNRIFFGLTNKQTTLSWVTDRCLSFHSASDPSEIPLPKEEKIHHRAPPFWIALRSLAAYSWRQFAQIEIAAKLKRSWPISSAFLFGCPHLFFAVPLWTETGSLSNHDGNAKENVTLKMTSKN